MKEQVHEQSRSLWLERLLEDVRYGLRVLRHSPAFTATAVLSLGIGIGANTAIFSVINALIRPLPVTRPQELVLLSHQGTGNISYPDYVALGDGSRVLSDLAAASSLLRGGVTVGADTEIASIKIVSSNYFAALGVPAIAGRVLGNGDDTEPVAVISRELGAADLAGRRPSDCNPRQRLACDGGRRRPCELLRRSAGRVGRYLDLRGAPSARDPQRKRLHVD